MSSAGVLGESPTEAAPTPEPEPRFGAATPLVVIVGIIVVSLVTWWLLGDPKWSFTNTSQPAIGADLFWVILAAIWTGFTFGNWPFSKVSQPLSGVLQVAANLAIGFLCVWLTTYVMGSWDPTFSHKTAAGAGDTASAFIVLVGFYAFAFASASWGGYPFEKVEGPTSGVAQWFMAAFITVIGVVIFIYPNFNAHLAANAPLKLVDALGWVYCSIVVLIVAAMLWENWPWAGIGNRHLRAIAAVVATLGGGLLVYWLLSLVVKAVVPGDIKALPTFSASQETAELGVCFSFWGLTWGLVCGAWPTQYSAAANRVIRTVIVTVLSILTYVVFMRCLGTKVLHVPALKGNDGGAPLTFMDWLILVLLWYTVAFGGYGSTRVRRSRR